MPKPLKNQGSLFDRIDPVTGLRMLSALLIAMALLLLFIALSREPKPAPDRSYNVGNIYRIIVPGAMNILHFDDVSVLFSGSYSDPDIMMIVDPEKEIAGEFLPVDANPAELASLTRSALEIADIFPSDLKLEKVAKFEFFLLPGMEFDFSFRNYLGTGQVFFARDNSFTCLTVWKKQLGKFAPRALRKLNNLQLLGPYRAIRFQRPVIDSSVATDPKDTIREAREKIQAAYKFYQNRRHDPGNVLRAIAALQRGFQLLVEADDATLISPQDEQLFSDCLKLRRNYFEHLRGEIVKQDNLKRTGKVKELLRRMSREASLDSEREWREWARRQRQKYSGQPGKE